jgi:hypothetical protein
VAGSGEKRNFPDWLKAFVEYGSYGEAPNKMLFWAGVSAIAGALRRRVWIDQKNFQWVPNFYIVMVAPPGIAGKSTTANIAIKLLKEVPGIRFGPDIVTWQSLLQTLAANSEGVADPADPFTFHTMSAITIASSEFGNFLDPDDPAMIDALVSLWDGWQGEFRKETKTSGKDRIINPWINIIGCTTPSWIANRYHEYLVGGGLTARCIFIYADKKRQHVAYVDEQVPENFEELRIALIQDLEKISLMFGKFEISEPARKWGREWYEKHWTSTPTINTEQYAGYMARKQTHIHKLAMVLSAAKSSDLIIHLDTLQAAEALVTAVESDMPKVFARIGQTEQTRGAATIVSIIEQAGRISKRELYSHLFRTMSFRDYETALMSAVQAGHVETRMEGQEMMLKKRA